jgi:hypothetical protein
MTFLEHTMVLPTSYGPWMTMTIGVGYSTHQSGYVIEGRVQETYHPHYVHCSLQNSSSMISAP